MEVVLGEIGYGGQADLHSHPGVEQAFFVIQGKAVVQVEGEDEVVGPDDFIYLPPGAAHRVTPLEGPPLKVLILYAPPLSLGKNSGGEPQKDWGEAMKLTDQEKNARRPLGNRAPGSSAAPGYPGRGLWGGADNLEAEPIIPVGAAMANTPLIDRLDKNPLAIISPGDLVRIDGDRGAVEVIEMKRAQPDPYPPSSALPPFPVWF
jgi:hypothetical protein